MKTFLMYYVNGGKTECFGEAWTGVLLDKSKYRTGDRERGSQFDRKVGLCQG